MGWLWLLLFNKIYQSTILLRLYKLYKFLARLTTSTTEIYRICYAASIQLGWQTGLESALDEKVDNNNLTTPLLETPVPAHIIYRIDRSILYSKQLLAERRELESDNCDVDKVMRAILVKKQFPSSSLRSPAARVLRICLIQIAETHQLTREINQRAHTKYDSTNPLHEQKLMRLWKALLPDTELESRLTRQWAEIGFQGNDPATDFRGMGMQGLDDLVYYTQQHPLSAQKAFTSSRHPVSWYPFAIVGINITQFAVQMLRTRQLQFYLFEHGTDKKTFSEFYCYLFHTFNEFWISHDEPKLTVMDFEMKFKEFKAIVGKDLMMRRVVPLTLLTIGRKEGQQEQGQEEENKIELQNTLRQRKPITMS